MRGWKAWYANGTVYDSSSTRWTDLPKTGIVGVVVYYESPYRRIVDSGDWYYLEGGEPTCTDTHEEWGRWVEPPDVPLDELKQSGTVSDERWSQIQDDMMDDKTWP